MEAEIRKRTTWSGEYRGITFEVQLFTRPEYSFGGDTPKVVGEKECWTFYLYLIVDAMPDDYTGPSLWLDPKSDEKSRVHYDYYEHPILPAIDWHCGMTWYSKEAGFEGGKKVVKVGCDYQHYWDEGVRYLEAGVIADAKSAIDSFHELVPGYKRRCSWNGNYYPESDGVITGERFLSHEGKRAQDEWSAERAAKKEGGEGAAA